MPAESRAPAAAPLLEGLPPVVSPRTRLLILGSFPSAVSLERRQYYANPRNQLWTLLQALWPEHPLPPAHDYVQRCQWLTARGLGLWDVFARCRRAGSLDASIRDAQANDLRCLHLPALEAVAHNGAASHAQAARLGLPPGVAVHRLPSTSPAHAAWSLARKTEAWRAAFAQHGLVAA
ncbi:DNA-deoxyinosine glycosylase [Pseudacidovorax intermedius]|uniref:DNA glycosylase n=1 Tax=Pseudacidovorax intermedius TaxID=433924 RepID=A0A147GLC6_9BURK|nr:DNA-deoxyinosine glycosylase [Pseudacidovorax intermedius]KTT13715.1 DNA glycosylase [Pseudacidovorax intermedius]